MSSVRWAKYEVRSRGKGTEQNKESFADASIVSFRHRCGLSLHPWGIQLGLSKYKYSEYEMCVTSTNEGLYSEGCTLIES